MNSFDSKYNSYGLYVSLLILVMVCVSVLLSILGIIVIWSACLCVFKKFLVMHGVVVFSKFHL